MPKQRQIRYLSPPRKMADGGFAWYWTPSPQLRKKGWNTLPLGRDYSLAVMAAIALNEQLDAWRAGDGAAFAVAPPAPALPRVVRFAELRQSFLLSDDFTGLSVNTQREYRSRLLALEHWAMDGQLPVKDITQELVLDLRKGLIAGSSKYRVAAMLRVLRLFLAFAERERVIPKDSNPASKIRIPEPPKRQQRIQVDDLPWLEEACWQLELPHVTLATVLGFYTMQRQGDLLATTQFKFQEVRDISPQAHKVLQGADGKVMGIALTQEKTLKPVCISLVPPARTALETALAPRRVNRLTNTYLLARPQDRGSIHKRLFNKDWVAVRDLACSIVVRAARAAGHAADWDKAYRLRLAARRLYKLQYRDLRRSGMCWLRDLSVPVQLIAANSGHTIKQTEKILDTYLPADTYSAAEGMAIAWAEQTRRDAEEESDKEIING